MNKIIKAVISVVMSFAIAICLVSTWARAEEVSVKEDDISLANVNIGVPYHIQDKWGKITAQFTNQSTFLVTYTDLSNTSRYISMYISNAGKEFPVQNFIVKANKAKSISYSLNVLGYNNLTITVYRHTSTAPDSSQIDSLTGLLPN